VDLGSHNKKGIIMALGKTQYICPSCGRKAVKQDDKDGHGHCFGCGAYITHADMDANVKSETGMSVDAQIQLHIIALQNLGCSLMVQSPDASVHMRVPKDINEVEAATATKKADGRAAIERKHDPKKNVVAWEKKYAKQLQKISDAVITADGGWVLAKNPQKGSAMRLFQSAIGNNLTQRLGVRGGYKTTTRDVEEGSIKVCLLKAIK
jgi:ribosomal protein L37AE/L43A